MVEGSKIVTPDSRSSESSESSVILSQRPKRPEPLKWQFHIAENEVNTDGCERDIGQSAPFVFMAGILNSYGKDNAQVLKLAPASLWVNSSNRTEFEVDQFWTQLGEWASCSEFIRLLLQDSRILKAPLTLDQNEFTALLNELELLKDLGIGMQIPKGWAQTGGKPQILKPVVSFTPDTNAKSNGLGNDWKLRFKFQAMLGEHALSHAELKEFLESGDSFLWVEGRWVMADVEKLRTLFQTWQELERVTHGEAKFADALRWFRQGQAQATGAQSPSNNQALDVLLEAELPELRFESNGKSLGIVESIFSSEQEESSLLKLKQWCSSTQDLMNFKLYPHQFEGLRWLSQRKRLGLGAVLADDMGLGKTLQSILLLRNDNELNSPKRPSLIVVPSSLLTNWHAELNRFYGFGGVQFLHRSFNTGFGSATVIEANDIYVTSYGSFLKYSSIFSNVRWNNIVIDEAQKIKNPSSQIHQSLRKLQADFKLALTGTPIENKQEDLIALLDFVMDVPQSSGADRREVKKTTDHNHDAPTGLDSMRHLVRTLVLRRKKTDPDLELNLPSKVSKSYSVLLSLSQLVSYQQEMKHFEHALNMAKRDNNEERSKKRRGQCILSTLQRLKQISSHAGLLSSREEKTDEEECPSRLSFSEEECAKLTILKTLVETIQSNNESVVVFSQYVRVVEMLQEYFNGFLSIPCFGLTGSMSIGKRQSAIDAFRKSGETTTTGIVISLKAGGTGLNLTTANHVVHFDHWWNPATQDQASDRVFRIGQNKSVLIHHLIAKSTIEESISKMLYRKREMAEDILTDSRDSSVNVFDVAKASDKQIVDLFMPRERIENSKKSPEIV